MLMTQPRVTDKAQRWWWGLLLGHCFIKNDSVAIDGVVLNTLNVSAEEEGETFHRVVHSLSPLPGSLASLDE